MKTLTKIFFFLLFLASGRRGWAQQDTLAPLRKFMHICGGYRQLPVQMDIELRNSSNLILTPGDTPQLLVSAVVCQKGTYITMDGMEQLANDSLLLIVVPKTKRMLLYSNHQSVMARLQYLGAQLQDSSLPRLAAKYRVKCDRQSKDTAFVELESRATLNHTSLAAEELKISYKDGAERPYAIVLVQRSLVPVSDSIYKSAAGKPEWAGRTLSIKDSSFFLVREQTRTFDFRRIEHQQASDPPVLISDRIAADLTGVYRPVKDYAAFRISQQVK